MRNHSRCLSFLLSGILSVSLLAPLSSAQAAYDGSIRNLVDRVTVLTESVQTESANEEELAKLDEMQAELEDKADAKEDVSETETVSMVVTGGTINVRTGPGTNYDKITQVVSGKQVTVVGESNGWYQVTFDSTTGWLLGEYLRDPADLDGTVGAKVVSMAMPFLGTRYRSGGASPNGFDCSGFTCRTRRPPSIRTAATPSPNPTCSPVIWCSSRIPHTPSATSASTSGVVRSSMRATALARS